MTAEISLTGDKLLKTVINKILAAPQTWNKTDIHSGCAIKYCLACYCQKVSGKAMNSVRAKTDATDSLGISIAEGDFLFSRERTIYELCNFAENFNKDDYDADGYSRDGYDRDVYDFWGFNRMGFNRLGFNRFGYDKYGYNRFGYNCHGYNLAGEKLKPFEL